MAGEGTSTRKTAKKTAKKTAQKTARKTTRRSPEKAAEDTTEGSARRRSSRASENGRAREDGPRAASRPRAGATKIAASAAQQLLELTGREAEGVTGLDRTDDGWTIQVEVVELRRIPDTVDVLGLYEVTTDDRGELTGYRRVRRYVRGDSLEE